MQMLANSRALKSTDLVPRGRGERGQGGGGGSRGVPMLRRNGTGAALGPLPAYPHVHSFHKQTKGQPAIREEAAHLIPNSKPRLYHFLTV